MEPLAFLFIPICLQNHFFSLAFRWLTFMHALLCGMCPCIKNMVSHLLVVNQSGPSVKYYCVLRFVSRKCLFSCVGQKSKIGGWM